LELERQGAQAARFVLRQQVADALGAGAVRKTDAFYPEMGGEKAHDRHFREEPQIDEQASEKAPVLALISKDL
jgi:hypothetical protein